MILDFCAVCGTKDNLHQHHILPVVYSAAKRAGKNYDENKKIKDCTNFEIWAYLLDVNHCSENTTVTVCEFHHNMMHGVAKNSKASLSNMIKEGLKKAVIDGKKLGRPTKLTEEMTSNIHNLYHKDKKNIREISKACSVGIGSVYRALRMDLNELRDEDFDDLAFAAENLDDLDEVQLDIESNDPYKIF